LVRQPEIFQLALRDDFSAHKVLQFGFGAHVN
jgi:hypothetical protein